MCAWPTVRMKSPFVVMVQPFPLKDKFHSFCAVVTVVSMLVAMVQIWGDRTKMQSAQSDCDLPPCPSSSLVVMMIAVVVDVVVVWMMMMTMMLIQALTQTFSLA